MMETSERTALTNVQEEMREWCAEIFRSVVDNDDAVRVDGVMKPAQDGAEPALHLLVSVGDGDLGKAIGKQGRIAHAVRVIIKAGAMKLKLGRVYLEVLNTQGECSDEV